MAFSAMFQGKANPMHLDAVTTALRILARESMDQPGTLRYDFFQLAEEPTSIILLAAWEDESLWKSHVESEVHERYVNSLPPGVWAIRPSMTRLKALSDSTDGQ